MLVSARYTEPLDVNDPEGPRMGILTIDGQDYSGPIPPNDGSLRAIYDAWIAQGYKPTPYFPPAPPDPAPISDRQFFHGLALWELIPRDEAMEAVKTGFIPTALVAILDQAEANGMFPEGMSRFDIDIVIAGATSYDFKHPVSQMVGQAFGWDVARRRQFWEFAGAL
jgi:hypothetical protein